MSEREQVRAVIFDIDDTLIRWDRNPDPNPLSPYRPYVEQAVGVAHRTNSLLTFSLDDALDALDQEFQTAMQRAVAANNMACTPFLHILAGALRRLGLELGDEPMNELFRQCRWELHELESIEPEVAEVLEELKARGIKTGTLSNAWLEGEMRANELQALGIRQYFDAVLTSADAGRFKPHPDVFHYVLGQLECPPSAAIMVGDSLRDDARASTAAGLKGVWYSPSGDNPTDIPLANDELHIRNMSELLRLLD